MGTSCGLEYPSVATRSRNSPTRQSRTRCATRRADEADVSEPERVRQSTPLCRLSVLGLPSVSCIVRAKKLDGVSPVPVTAKLSRRFYETLGDEIANELVEWFNQVDATYRADLIQLNELNFSRFDSRLEQRMAQLDAKWNRSWSELGVKLETRIAQLESKFGQQLAQFRADKEST